MSAAGGRPLLSTATPTHPAAVLAGAVHCEIPPLAAVVLGNCSSAVDDLRLPGGGAERPRRGSAH